MYSSSLTSSIAIALLILDLQRSVAMNIQLLTIPLNHNWYLVVCSPFITLKTKVGQGVKMGGNKEEVIRRESRRGEPEIVGLVQNLDCRLDYGLNCLCASWQKLCLTRLVSRPHPKNRMGPGNEATV